LPFRRLQFWRFKQHRQFGEPRIVEEFPERFEPQTSFADVFVPIDAAAAWFLRVVQVKHTQPIEPDEAIEIPERRRIPFIGAQVVPRRQQMTGIEADTDP